MERHVSRARPRRLLGRRRARLFRCPRPGRRARRRRAPHPHPRGPERVRSGPLRAGSRNVCLRRTSGLALPAMTKMTITTEKHPRGLYTLFFTEMWERFSYYGMRALLVLFMVDQTSRGGLGFGDATATAIYGLYTAGVYLACLPGGWVADRLLGAQRAVLV